MRGKKIRVAIFPFEDRSLIGQDATLEKGFAIALYDLLKGTNSLYHPYSVFEAARAAGLNPSDYFSDVKILTAASRLGATHVVYGLFQKQEGNQIRYFIKIAAVGQKKSPRIHEFAAELSDRFFSVARDAALVIAGEIGQKNAKLPAVSDDPGFETFRYYLKGMEKADSYNPVDLQVARVWFEKATTLSYGFRNGFLETARTLLMEALTLKESGKDFSLQQSQGAELLARWGLGRPTKTLFALNPYRWTLGHEAFVTGMSFFRNSQIKMAEKYFKQAATLVPEDGLAHYYLAKILKGQNGEHRLARQLNNCLP